MKKIYNKLILLCLGFFLSASAMAQSTVSGKVIDSESGEGLIGAAVRIQATSIGTVTDVNGNFSLSSDTPLPWIVLISYSGYKTQRIDVTSSGQSIDVSLVAGVELEGVTVTAQKRPQNPIEVPIAMTVVTGDDILDNGISNMTEMAVKIPNVDINTGFAAPTLSIRGITSSGTNAGFDQSVATFVDGFYAGKPQMVLSPFLDVQQVEVLKGPQPTFFGQSAIAGALSIVTAKPGEDGDGYVNLSYGTQNEYNLEAAYNLRPSDQFGVRIAGKYNNFDGFLEETKTGDLFGGFTQYAGRLTAEWKPSDKFDATVKVELNDRVGDGTGIMRNRDSQYSAGDLASFPAAFVEGSMGAALAFDGADPDYQEYDATAEEFIVNVGGDQPLPTAGAVLWDLSPVGGPTGIPTTDLSGSSIMRSTGENEGNQDVNSEVYQLNMNLKLGDYTLQSVTASGGFESSTWLDVDMSRYALFHVNGVAEYSQFSQELRLISPDNQKFNWMIGGYYQSNDWTQDNRVHQATIGTTGARLTEESTWTSVFASLSLNVTSKLFVEGGLRYSDVSKDGDLNSIAGFVDASTTASATTIADNTPFYWDVNRVSSTSHLDNQTYTTNAVDPTLSLLWKDTRTTYYAKYSKAIKAGGFNVGNSIDVNTPTFDDETANAVELGIKGVSEDFKFRYNVAIFRTDYQDLQISAFDNQTSSFIVTNAGKAITQGIELDGTLIISEKFTLSADVAVTDAEFDEYITGPNSDELASGENIVDIDGVTVVDRSGYELKFSPDYQFTIRPELTFPMADYNLTVNANISYRDDYQTGDNYYNSDQQEAHELIDLNVGYAKKDGSWGLSLYARNITNRYYLTVSNDSTVIPGRNARFGLQARVRF